MPSDDIRNAEIQETGRIVHLIMRESGLRYGTVSYDDKGRSIEFYVSLSVPTRDYSYKVVLIYQEGKDLFDCYLFRFHKRTLDEERTEIVTDMYADSLPNWIKRTYEDRNEIEWFSYY